MIGKFEVHAHSFVSGPRAKFCGAKVVHSHEGGERPHQHPHTGPATYTIDRDVWAKRTGGVRGGSRKKYTTKPNGEQMPWVELEDWQKSFEVIIVGDPTPEYGEGPGIALPERIAQQFNIPYTIRDERNRKGAR